MGNIVKKLAEIKQQYVPIRPIFPVMLPQMLAQPFNGKRIALMFHGSPIIVDKCPAKNRNQGIVA